MPKRVALTMRMVRSPRGEWRDAVSQEWARYLEAQDILPILVPNDPESCLPYLEDVDGLILTGGDDIVLMNPKTESENPLAQRDRTEVRLLEESIRRKLPVLGVCRGMQLLHWYGGGILEKGGKEKGHVAKEHAVTCTGNLARLLAPSLRVNSFHENLIAKAVKPFAPCATDAGGFVEAFEDPTRRLLGIMWHPERPFTDRNTMELHAQFIAKFLTHA